MLFVQTYDPIFDRLKEIKPFTRSAKEIVEEKRNNNSWWRWLFSFIGSTAISIGFSFFTGGLSLLLEPIVQLGFDLITDYVIFQDEFNALDFSITLITNSIPFLTRISKYNALKQRNLFKNGIRSYQKFNSIKKSGLDITNELEKFGTKNFNMNYKNLLLNDELKAITRESAKYTAFKSIQVLKTKDFIKKIDYLRKASLNVRKAISAISDPTYSIRKFLDKLVNPTKNKIIKKINKNIDSIVDEIKKKIKLSKEVKILKNINSKAYIPLNSKWIEGVKFYKSTNPLLQNMKVFFNKEVNKKTITLLNKDFNKTISFINSSSPGKFYLDNFAWGWTVGKFIRMYSDINSISKWNKIHSLFNNTIFAFRTFTGVLKIKENWDIRRIFNKAFDAAKETLTGWTSIRGFKTVSTVAKSLILPKSQNYYKKLISTKTAHKTVSNTTRYIKLKEFNKRRR
uniref:Uncharacterized protein n=1 Tax=Mycoplasma anserisalpingitidis TaxID=519450 RepID=A0A8F2E5D3_9MOLU|nr:hypothetical protein [Mycoplasma anserisalpingitidis]